MPLDEHNTADPQRAVEVRIGVHSGQVAERDGDLLGQAVHATARVMTEAVGGEILITDEIRKQASRSWTTHFSTPGFSGCGIPELWRLYEVSWNDTSAGPRPGAAPAPLTAFVSGDAERAACAGWSTTRLSVAAG
jgi:class 3 adenylate cyclase